MLLGLGLIFAYFFRPKDPLFSWLAAFVIGGFFVATGMFMGWQPALQRIQPFTNALVPAMGFLFVGIALALINVQPPKTLRFIAIAVPCALLPCALIDTTLSKIIVA